jgi:parallel beta-helix repeat protein
VPSLSITGNKIYQCSVHGLTIANVKASVSDNYIQLDADGICGIRIEAAYAIVSNNVIVGNTTCEGVSLASAQYTTVSNNRISSCSLGIHLSPASNINVMGNNITSCSYGIYQENAASGYNTFEANVITSSIVNGARFDTGVSENFNGNTIMNSGGYGVSTYVGGITFANNKITDNQTPKTQTYAIRANGALDNFIIANNDFSGNLTGALSNVSPTNYWPTTGAGFGTDVANFNRTV